MKPFFYSIQLHYKSVLRVYLLDSEVTQQCQPTDPVAELKKQIEQAKAAKVWSCLVRPCLIGRAMVFAARLCP